MKQIKSVLDNSIEKEDTIIIKPKRGRKPKSTLLNQDTNKDISQVNKEDINTNDHLTTQIFSLNESGSNINISNLQINIDELNNDSYNNYEQIDNNENDIDNNENDIDEENYILKESNTSEIQKTVSKKRGRKPKGGKIIQYSSQVNVEKKNKPNIILHLKCYLKDLNPNASSNNNIESYNFLNKNDLTYELISNPVVNVQNETSEYDVEEDEPKDKYKELWKKIKQLENNLHINNISDKKSACFWCTYDFDNPPIYIPKYFLKNTYHVYGCFCSPECATAFLMEENIDSSTKFERYHFINHLYAKIYNYEKNIKPAPNPYYMLDKFYGNLSIQEYRSLFKNERLFLIVDKPLTRVLPELHEDNNDFILNNKIIPSNNYNIKRKLQNKNQNKTNILNEKFGISTFNS
jgi:hypothetical protein